MNLKPIGDRVILKVSETEEKTEGGIVIPDTAKERPQRAEVVAVGSGSVDDKGERIALEVQVGDKVIFGKFSGSEVKLEGEKYLLVRESDILAIVE